MNMITIPVAILLMALGVVKLDNSGKPAGNASAIHVFGGQTAKVELVVEPTNGNLAEPMEIQADLFQKGESLLAPIQKDIIVAKASRYEKCFQNEPSLRPLLTWELPVPEVKRETEMLARLRIKSGGGEWVSAGQILITAYPLEFTKGPLAELAKEWGFHVFGENKNLRNYLKANKVEFDDAGDDLQALPTKPEDKGIYIGDADAQFAANWLASHSAWPSSIVVFCTDSPLLPGVYVSEHNGFRIVKVTLPLLDTLPSDPRSQKTFLEILKLLNTPPRKTSL